MSTPTSEDRWLGGLFIAVGALMMTLCGSCTLLFTIGMVTGGSEIADLQLLLLPALIGGLPTIAGWFILRAGMRRYRGLHRPNRHVPKTFD